MSKILFVILVGLFSQNIYAQDSESAGALETKLSTDSESKPGLTFNLSAQTTYGGTNTGSTNIDNLPDSGESSARFTTFTPQIGIDLKGYFLSSVYLALPLYWDSSNEGASSRTFGRPEIGFGKLLLDSDTLNVELDLALRLPFYEDSSGYYVEGNRVFQIAPALAADIKIPHSRFHIVSSTRLSYDSKAFVVTPDGNGLERPLTLRSTIGLEVELKKMSFGTGFRATNGLGSGRVTNDGSISREVSPLDLLAAEFTGTYQLRDATKLNFSVTKGIKTRSDFYTLVQQDAPEEIADATMSLGLTQNF